jgi:sugar (pentulose or hexulose) kinase
MSRAEPVVIGIDVGTQGARVVAHEASGILVGSESERFGDEWVGERQDPEDWWRAVDACLGRIMHELGDRAIDGVSVTSTSGTVLPLDSGW